MNPETPSGGLRTSRGDQAGRPGDQAGTQMDASFGNVLDTPLRPAEFSDQALESESSDRKRGVLNAVKNTATSQLNAQKSRATDQLDRIAENVRQSTRRLREEQHGAVAAVLERGADELERLTASLRDRDIDDFMRDLEGFARRQPALFLGSSLAAGLLLARFAKAGERQDGGRYGRRAPGGESRFGRPGSEFIGQENL